VNNPHLTIEAEVFPTEDKIKVEQAIKRLFPLIELEMMESPEGTKTAGHAKGVDALLEFRDLLRRERIRAAAKSMMYSSLHDSRLQMHLNKQAAYVGHISFASDPRDSPLGPITVTIECEQPQNLIEWLVETEGSQ
jgi:predicted RNA binding protein with dsRBD fold (UPF0201 family)